MSRSGQQLCMILQPTIWVGQTILLHCSFRVQRKQKPFSYWMRSRKKNEGTRTTEICSLDITYLRSFESFGHYFLVFLLSCCRMNILSNTYAKGVWGENHKSKRLWRANEQSWSFPVNILYAFFVAAHMSLIGIRQLWEVFELHVFHCPAVLQRFL